MLKQKLYKVGVAMAILVVVIGSVYMMLAGYYRTHFYHKTLLNHVDISGKTVDQVNELIDHELNTYQLDIKGRENQQYTMNGQEMGLTLIQADAFQEIKKEQNGWRWIQILSKKNATYYTQQVDVNEETLEKSITTTNTFQGANPQDAYITFSEGEYIIVPEQHGAKVNQEQLVKVLSIAAQKQLPEVNLHVAGCYVEPVVTTESPEIQAAQQLLNTYIKTNICYLGNEMPIEINETQIKEWLIVTPEFEVLINEHAVKQYVEKIKEEVLYTYQARPFTTTQGEIIQLSQGDYDYEIDVEQETQQIIQDIQRGETLSRFPKSTGVGNTYIEIDLANQHLYLYENNVLMAHDDIVTGNVSAGHKTPGGIYTVKWKTKNRVLRGDDYAAFVRYWMPFNGGIGVHDADWRTYFGGDIYETNGSHGCINCPIPLAKTVYETIEAGTPVICYW